MYVASTQHLLDLNYSRQECKWASEKHYLQFIILTHLWPLKKVKVIAYDENVDPKQGYNHAKFKR